ncbi:radical SAM protein [Anaerocolumna sp. AGMB13025]|uniref:radical SAM/SPASM domain-containing protein n=1 Tax=Anaerocolumna sp. AGMB13025 TaxID=3039116 RepID=UPI00241F3B35|nr:radical SAM protein [Anaerocolumna sp. AGMB13025]WFR57014.1 radical SAM protein [Anaerocolumna sp. AGMB13025]
MNIQFIKDEEISVAFFPDSKRFFVINDGGYELIKAISTNENSDLIMNKFKLDNLQYDEYRRKIEEYCTPVTWCQEHFEVPDGEVLNRLVINLTNCCNLRCKYCYANGGHYHSDEAIMSKKMIDDIFIKFYGKFNIIRSIQLFGGEPLMNIDIIEYICQYVKIRDLEKGHSTHIGIVTNGTLISDRFIELVKNYNISVTISYDGHPLVNDLLRIDAYGNGTSSKILENAKRLKNITGQPNTIEVTYTQFHIDNNITIMDVLKHLNTELPETYIHLVPAGGNIDCEYALTDLSQFTQSVNDIFDTASDKGDIKHIYSLVQRIIASLVNKYPGSESICDAGSGTLSVSVNGDIYPCFMFTDFDDICLGNIYDDNIFSSQLYENNLNKIHNFNLKASNEKCINCSIKTLCSGCLGLNFLNTGDIFTMDDKNCDMSRKMAENVILRLAKFTDIAKKENEEYDKARE